MRRVYQIASIVFLMGAIFVGTYSWLELKFYTRLGPGPGFFPFWLAVAFGALSVFMFFDATFRQTEPLPADFFPTRTSLVRIGAIVVTLVGTVFLLEPLGFRLTMLVFFLFLLHVLGKQHVVVTVLVSLAGSFGVFYLFVDLLKIPLPIGTFGI